MSFIKYLPRYRIRHMRELLSNEKKAVLPCEKRLDGKTVVLSGATSGIGLETARLFAARGASLICLNRNPDKSEALERELRDQYGCRIRTLIVDFSSLKEIRHCAEELNRMEGGIDVLIHNAAVFNTRKKMSKDRIEMVFHVNHLSSFMLNYMLKEKLREDNRARILYVNSEGHRFALSGVHLNDLNWRFHIYGGLKSYGAAKTAQLLTMIRFARYFSGSRVTVNAMHPGNVKSSMGENNGRFYRHIKRKLILSSAKDPEISARALYYLAASDDMDGVSGQFFNLTAPETPAPHAGDLKRVNAVWEKSLELCGLS